MPVTPNPDQEVMHFDLLDPRHKAINSAFSDAYEKATPPKDQSEMDACMLVLSYATSLCVFLGLDPAAIGSLADDLAHGHQRVHGAPETKFTVQGAELDIKRKPI